MTITGTTPLLFHRWSAEAVEEKKKAPKGSKAKNDDNLESYLWRDDDGIICLPGLYLLGALTDPRNGAAKYRQDPRSPRKSALDLYRAGVSALTELAPVTSARTGAPSKDWDFLDERRAMVQRSAINRIRPAFLTGWEATVQFLVVTPEYISPEDLLDAFNVGGRLVGVGDFRPTFGRFVVTRFD
ncbi:MAG: hypothetical protein IT195_13965, partial [Microthrixaceae bacterium]|nr:hypothetical protein [Microthrixaceae bacterium]